MWPDDPATAGAGNNDQSGGDDSLAGRLNSQSALATQFEPPAQEGGESPPSPPTPPPSGVDKETLTSIINDAVAPLKQELATAKMEGAQLRGMINIMSRERQAPAATQPAAPQAPKKTDAQWAEELRNNPVETLRALVSELVSPLKAELSGEIQNKTANVAASVDTRERVKTAYQSEVNFVNSEFPVVKDRPDFNQAFYDDMDREWQSIVQRDNGALSVGQLREAAFNVQHKWTKSGKNPWTATQSTPTNGAARPTEVRTVARQTVRVNGSAGANGAGGGKPTTLAELNLSAEEQTAAREIIRRAQGGGQKFTEADFVRNYLAANEEVPNFGN